MRLLYLCRTLSSGLSTASQLGLHALCVPGAKRLGGVVAAYRDACAAMAACARVAPIR